ncbi:hypothetical protein [Streptomyces lichenis]|uniref:Uncharacterized protein n=1 Tax=Streptomyces lichenis TaxID=2306967 RepID=A0ABT0IIH7_9ACTN|nr:hypothetical protein [Streptomyces lichenis]MCK8681119.1 hypothetical protein [Streptomyces lichenis]
MAGEGQRRVLIEVGRLTCYPEPLGRTGYSYHPVGHSRSGMLGWNAVWGTPAEEAEWRAVGERFSRAVHAAEDAYRSYTRRRTVRHLPGARRRRERAAELFRAALADAEEGYAPVREEIGRRLAAGAEEARREREEEARRWEAERAEREALRAAAHARHARYHALASRRVWGWAVDGDGAAVLVYRGDLPAGPPPPEAAPRSAEPLTVYGLEEELLALGDEGLTTLRWDLATRESVMAECSVPGDPVAFEEWWAAVTRRRWRSSAEVPPRPPGRPRSGTARGPGSQGHSGSDYGGVGDSGSGYGDSGGGYGGGFSGGGFGSF